MVWDGSANGGFTEGKPWLPVKPPQLARNVAAQEGVAGSVLETYRALLAFRKANRVLVAGRSRFLDLPEPVLGFERELDGEALTCVFNLGRAPVSVMVPGAVRLDGPSQAAVLEGEALRLGPNGFGYCRVTG